MQKNLKNDINIFSVRDQYSRLENITKEFSEKLVKLKKAQEEFDKSMKLKNLFH